MPEFILDTSGTVVIVEELSPGCDHVKIVAWADLDAFTQGCIEALFFALPTEPGENPGVVRDRGGALRQPAFRDLAPEALAAILRDCAEFNKRIGDASHNRGIGAAFWKARQAGFNAHWSLHQKEMVAGFPPLTVSLGDDGKVYLS